MMYLYQKMRCPKSTRKGIFTLPGHSLPSQYRTLLPVSDPEVERMMRVERTSRHIRNAVLALAAVLIIIVIVIVALIVAFQVSVDTQGQLVLYTDVKNNARTDDLHSVRPNQSGTSIALQHLPLPGTPCHERCWEYSAFKFQATCENSVCRCQDKFYDDVTCLPVYADCHIKLYTPSSSMRASRSGLLQNMYVCQTGHRPSQNPTDHQEEEEVHHLDIDELSRQTQKGQKAELDHYQTSTNSEEDTPDASNASTSIDSGIPRHQRNSEETMSTVSDKGGLASTVSTFVEGGVDSVDELPSPNNISQEISAQSSYKNSKDSSRNAPVKNELSSNNTETEAEPKETASFQRLAQVHVISVHSNHGAPATNVRISSISRANITLVLVSYEPIVWNVTAEESPVIQRVYLVSNHRLSRCQVFISHGQNLETNLENAEKWPPLSTGGIPSAGPPVTRMLLKTGYGNDKRSGSTPQMLQQLSHRIGQIQTFIGVAHADSIVYNIDFH